MYKVNIFYVANAFSPLRRQQVRRKAVRLGWTALEFAHDGQTIPILSKEFADEATAMSGVAHLARTGGSGFLPLLAPGEGFELSEGYTCANLLGSSDAAERGKSLIGSIPVDFDPTAAPRTGQPPAGPDVPRDPNPVASPEAPEAPKPVGGETSEPPATPLNPPPFEELHDEFWSSLTDDKQRELAEQYFRATITDQVSESESEAWVLAAELILLKQLPGSSRAELSAQLLRQKARLVSNQSDLDQQNFRLREKTVIGASITLEMARENLRHMMRWRQLSRLAATLITLGSLFSAGMVIWLFAAYDLKSLPGYLVPVVIFVLGVFGISPAVLLLLERPLKGIDEFVPGGRVADEEEKEAAAAAKKKEEDAAAAAKKKEEASAAAAKAEAEKKSLEAIVAAAIKAGKAPGGPH